MWLKWEMLELNAILEAINIKSEMEARKVKKVQKKESDRRNLEQLNTGRTTIKTMLLSKDAKVNKITNLTRSISAVRPIYCLINYWL